MLDAHQTEAAGLIDSDQSDLPPERQVLRWLIEGQTEHDIIEAIGVRFPDRDAGEVIGTAIESVAASGQFSRDVVRGWCYEAYRDLYRKMVSIGDYAGALKAVKLIQGMT